jgi:SAM-dependent methyltransferase
MISAYETAASDFERQRALPTGVAGAIRAAVLLELGAKSRPRLLDLGAGTGRIGWPFVTAGDDYVGADLSRAMLRGFAVRHELPAACVPLLVQTDGQCLPFSDGSFDAVLLMHVLSGASNRRRLLLEAKRVLGSTGLLMAGRTIAPDDGVDARMKQRLGGVLTALGIPSYSGRVDDARAMPGGMTQASRTVTAASWRSQRTPRRFLERHPTGARFAALPAPIRDIAMRRVRDWARTEFGSLDAEFTELYHCELTIFRFDPGKPH